MVRVSLLNGNSDVDWVAKRSSTGVAGLPGTFIRPFAKWGGEQDLNRCLSPCLGGIQRKLLRCPKVCPTDMFQAITRVPVTGTAVGHPPLFVECQTKCGKHIIRNGDIFDKGKVV